jgi:hypothetical protein
MLAAAAAVAMAACRFGVDALPEGGVGGVGGPDLASVPADAAVPGLVEGSVTAPALATDLSTLGTLDWAHWGYTAATDFDHRLGADAIPTFTPIGGATALQFTAFANSFSWSDGTPHAAVLATNTGVYMVGGGTGFALDLPADGAMRVVRVFAGNYNSTARFVAHLRDGSAPDYVAENVDNGAGSYRLFIVRYRASVGTTLQVTWQSIAGPGNIALQAVALALAP